MPNPLPAKEYREKSRLPTSLTVRQDHADQSWHEVILILHKYGDIALVMATANPSREAWQEVHQGSHLQSIGNPRHLYDDVLGYCYQIIRIHNA